MNDGGKRDVGEVSKGWLHLDSESVFKASFFNLYKDRVKCVRTDTEADFYRFTTYNWVNVIAETPDGRIVMVKQYRHGAGLEKLEVPGGCIDPGETDPVVAGVRELFEETGYRGVDAKIIGRVHPNPALMDNYCYTVYVKGVEKVGNPCMDDTEDIETFLMTKQELLESVRVGDLDHGLVLNAVYFYLMEKGNIL